MKYQVYQKIEPDFMAAENPVNFPEGFEMVAEVVTDGHLEKVFELTNHIDKPWWENTEVKCHRKRRSTSVGDVVVDEEGRKHFCDMAGWRQF